MNYIDKIKRIIQAGLLFIILSGCSDWLRVDPIDQILEDQIFGSEYNVQTALNGIYLKMGENSLYGRELSNRTIELLAQQYFNGEGASDDYPLKFYVSNYTYSEDVVKNIFSVIWTGSYSTILNINNFIEKLDRTQGVVLQNRKAILLGEAYALRAYMHLDMLRLFGPVYATDSTAFSIPYYTEPKAVLRDREPASDILNKIIEDIDKALELLKGDPVITEGVMTAIEDDLSVSQREIDPFYRNRNRRINYYAAAVLKVRALMYGDRKEEARVLAKSLLEESSGIPDKFPWASSEQVFNQNREDYVFSSEVLFGIYSANMYSNWTNDFSPGITRISRLLASATSNLMRIFDVTTSVDLSTDMRARHWKIYQDAAYMVNYKFSRSYYETNVWYFQPLIRKSELYYVLAECESNFAYIDEVRIHRGLKTVAEVKLNAVLDTEIQNEYMREFFGEGQLFYFYKRKNLPSIQNGSPGSVSVSMRKNTYIPPIPQKELDR
jgi:hypothetical protein